MAAGIQTDWEKDEGRGDERVGSVRLTLVELLLLPPKDGSLKECLPAFMAVSRDRPVRFPSSNTWDSFTLAGLNDGATNIRQAPLGRGEDETGRRQERRRKNNVSVLERV